MKIFRLINHKRTRIRGVVIFCLFMTLVACGQAPSTPEGDEKTPESKVLPLKPSPPSLFSSLISPDQVESSPPTALGTFKNTYYYLKEELPYAQLPKDTPVKDLKGRVIATVNSKFKKLMDIEGSGKLIDGRVVNYIGKVGGEIRYQVTSHEWGLGVGDCGLIPFHTVAVDPHLIPLGSIVQITETIKMPLPDGSLHDGYWIAADMGSAIQDDRVDLFSGKEDWGDLIEKYHIDHLQALHVILLAKPTLTSCVLQQPN